MAACAVPVFVFDISKTAAQYSAAAGVLAGFAFTAIPLLVTSGGGVSLARRGHAATAFVCAFFGLILATIEYGVLAGEPTEAGATGRAAIEELTNGCAFGLSVLLLLYGLLELLPADREYRAAVRAAKTIVVGAGPLIVLGFVFSGAGDVEVTRGLKYPGPACEFLSPTQWGEVLVLALAAAEILIVATIRPTSQWARDHVNLAPFGVLALTVMNAFAQAALTSIVTAKTVLPAWTELAIFAFMCASVTAFSVFAVLARPADTPALVARGPQQPTSPVP